MAQFAFYLAGGTILGFGRLGVLIAWDPNDRGPQATENIMVSDIALYSWMGPLPSSAGDFPSILKIKSKSPIKIGSKNCPRTLDGSPGEDRVVKFGVKSGGTGASLIVDCWLDVFDSSTRVYGIAPENGTIKIELAEGSLNTAPEASIQDRLTLQAMGDPIDGGFWVSQIGGTIPCKELWRDLMTPNLPVKWFPGT